MGLSIGTQLGSHEITALLGKGGMGEVYRARDTKLKRDVAIKIIPDEFSRDPARVSRFQREAEVLASLNHPNIAAIYDLQEAKDTRFLVLELVEGETLAERIHRDRIPVEEALRIAHQIAEAFEAAHEKGVIHRDLKPANVKITPEGKVKVLDFGLAKALEAVPQQVASNSPTILTGAATNGGMILGTAGYMSPEQARGHTADERSDIFSFGCVLYEVLTGRQTFQGETVTDLIASVVAREPDWHALPPDLHPGIESLVRRCLAKNRKDRRHSVADIRVELETIMTDPHGRQIKTAIIPQQTPLLRRALAIIGALVVGAALTAAAFWLTHPASPPAVMTRFPLQLPEGQVFTNLARQVIAISHDGTQFAYVANQQLYLRTMAQMEARPIPGANQYANLNTPFFSPDGRWIGFYGQSQQIKKIALSGGAAIPICNADLPFGASWSADDDIFIGQGPKGILKCRANGGKPETVVTVKPGELAQSPQLLPGGDALLFTLANVNSAGSGISNRGLWDKAQVVVQSLKSGERKILFEGGSDARYSPTGHIVYALGPSLLAVPFDVRTLKIHESSVSVVEGVMRAAGTTGGADFSFSDTGSLIYVPETAVTETRTLAKVDRAGVRTPLNLPPGSYNTPRISPDGKQLAFFTDDVNGRNIWIYDLDGNKPMRQLTFGGNNHRPVWTRDGKKIVFSSDREGDQALFWQAADGTGIAERLAKVESRFGGPQSEMWSLVKDVVLFSMSGPPRSLWTFSLGDEKPKQLIGSTSYSVSNGTFSLDGNWIAYFSGATGENEVYAQPFPLTGETHKITTGGGFDPVWSPDGKLFYTRGLVVGAREMFAVDLRTQPTFMIEKITRLPIEGLVSSGPRSYDISPDGKYFIILTANNDSKGNGALQQFHVTLNWFEELKQRVPAH